MSGATTGSNPAQAGVSDVSMAELVNLVDREVLRDRVKISQPVKNFCIDNFLKTEFAEEVLAAFPQYEETLKVGKSHYGVNEKGKVQVTDANLFPPPIKKLHALLSSPPFLSFISYVIDIPELLADHELVGAGIHQTGPRGHLDVHVDFNYIAERQLHRRVNILIYFNQPWKEEWGGNFELWDKDVQVCSHSFSPIFNRCVVFNTNETSFHGVTAVRCPENMTRKSFAAYYYTKAAPAGYTGENHSTIFRARPGEGFKGNVLMPAEKAKKWMSDTFGKAKRGIGKIVGDK